MPPSLRAFLHKIIDYAGLFPPAKLPLNTAFKNFARYQSDEEAWMLARFICPAAQLSDLGPLLKDFSPQTPATLSVLGRGGENEEEFITNLHDDVQAVTAFRADFGDRATIAAFETRLPAGLVSSNEPSRASGLLANIEETHAAMNADLIMPDFYEPPLTGDWQQSIEALTEGFQQYNADGKLPASTAAGLKLRCGGLDASTFPTTEQVAFVIQQCCRRNVPLKFTAGLHHPIRHHNATVQTKMHGFINVFGAGVLASALSLEYHDILTIIEEEDPRQFHFEEDFFAWNDAAATVREIEYARKHTVISVGSCSFDEPREDLRQLGLLPH